MKKVFYPNAPFIVPTTDGKLIEEHHGLASTGNPAISIAHMIAPPKWRSHSKLLNLKNTLIS
jgi:hypothetical protein